MSTLDAYRSFLRRHPIAFPCPLCFESVLPQHFENHCCTSHAMNPKLSCVWCLGLVSWPSLHKRKNLCHILPCMKKFLNFLINPDPSVDITENDQLRAINHQLELENAHLQEELQRVREIAWGLQRRRQAPQNQALRSQPSFVMVHHCQALLNPVPAPQSYPVLHAPLQPDQSPLFQAPLHSDQSPLPQAPLQDDQSPLPQAPLPSQEVQPTRSPSLDSEQPASPSQVNGIPNPSM